MRCHRLAAFFLLTFGISWGIPGLALLSAALTGAFDISLGGYAPLAYLVIWAPAIAAFTVIGMTQGRAGIRAYARRLLHWRVGWVWYAAVLLGVPLMNFLAAALTQAMGRPALTVPTVSAGAFLLAALLRGTQGPFEELGWRGFALPLLQRRFSGLQASIILGLFWALWHVPAFFIGRTEVGGGLAGPLALALIRFVVALIAQAVIMTVIYNGSGGSIPLMFVFHWMTNLPYPWETGADISPMQDVLGVAIAVVLVLTLGRRYLGRRNLYTDLTPGTPEPV